MGLKTDLNLVGNQFSNVATWFFIASLIAEVPNGKTLAHADLTPTTFLSPS